jgi:predicted ribosomally synthesized peptide with nif11-like leader
MNMAENVIQAFLQLAAKDQQLAEQLKQVKNSADILAIASSHGFQISSEDAENYKKHRYSELTDAELEALAGGSTEWGTYGLTCWA